MERIALRTGYHKTVCHTVHTYGLQLERRLPVGRSFFGGKFGTEVQPYVYTSERTNKMNPIIGGRGTIRAVAKGNIFGNALRIAFAPHRDACVGIGRPFIGKRLFQRFGSENLRFGHPRGKRGGIEIAIGNQHQAVRRSGIVRFKTYFSLILVFIRQRGYGSHFSRIRIFFIWFVQIGTVSTFCFENEYVKFIGGNGRFLISRHLAHGVARFHSGCLQYKRNSTVTAPAHVTFIGATRKNACKEQAE